MENELQDSPRGRGSAIAWSLATILILLGMLVASALTFICHDKVSNLINPEKDNVEQVCVDTIYTCLFLRYGWGNLSHTLLRSGLS